MAQTYKQLQKQIEQLQQQADALRSDEIKGVVERIKVAIAHYGLTAAHLGLIATKPGKDNVSARKSAVGSKIQFSDGNGNVWAGRGPRPHWLRDAIAAGRSIEEFRAGPAAAAKPPQSLSETMQSSFDAKRAAKRAKRAPSKYNYADVAGNSWTGRGPKPRWLKAAIEGGKTLQDFAK